VSEPTPPGVAMRRYLPKFHYELIACGLSGHMLVGMDAAEVRDDDAAFVRTWGTRRWYRCLRCDSWLPLPPPDAPRRQFIPAEAEIQLPLRGKALRDKFVLRLIAIDRAVHFLVLGALAVLIFVFASHRGGLKNLVNRIDEAFYGAPTSSHVHHSHGLFHDLERLVTLNVNTLRLIGLAAAVYAVLEGAEAIGLWFQRRWAEYLTFIATAAFLPFEVYELSRTVTVLKVLALIVNLAIVAYLLYAKRLFGLRGGGAAEEEARAADSGWEAFHRYTPPTGDVRMLRADS
jgi:uncharacterized membrane protein (DUF2068 family)